MNLKSRRADSESFLYLIGFVVLIVVAFLLMVYGPTLGLANLFDPNVIGISGIIIIWTVGGILGLVIIALIRRSYG
ncbi:MAG: hypothetical protein ACTSUV_00825 [Candidatus Ranarchaeia archaeon]